MRVLNTLQIMFCCQQAKALNAMDEEFGIGDLVEEEFGAKKVCDFIQEKDQCWIISRMLDYIGTSVIEVSNSLLIQLVTLHKRKTSVGLYLEC